MMTSKGPAEIDRQARQLADTYIKGMHLLLQGAEAHIRNYVEEQDPDDLYGGTHCISMLGYFFGSAYRNMGPDHPGKSIMDVIEKLLPVMEQRAMKTLETRDRNDFVMFSRTVGAVTEVGELYRAELVERVKAIKRFPGNENYGFEFVDVKGQKWSLTFF